MKRRTAGHPLSFACGAEMKNRFMLAPMTNSQSFENGQLSDDEYRWLTMRAEGQFGMVMTCASHVQEAGKGFPGQLGIFDDRLLQGHQRLAAGIKAHGSLAVIQLHHAGMRSPEALIGRKPLCPSDNEKHGARALSLAEVQRLRDDFIAAAVRAKKAGYDGAEIHGAHGYILTQFFSAEINQRTDAYGGSLENRARLLLEITDGIRKACGADFLLGMRLSPEKFGMRLPEVKWLCERLVEGGQLDFLDISLWDYRKGIEGGEASLLDYFSKIDYKNTRWTVAGKIKTAADVAAVLEAGVDFVAIGRSAILHHDFPVKVLQNPHFEPVSRPVSPMHLQREGLGEAFITYMRKWPGFVEEES